MRNVYVKHKNHDLMGDVIKALERPTATGDKLGMVYGLPGTGKSVSALWYVQRKKALYSLMLPTWSVGGMLRNLTTLFGLPVERSMEGMVDRLVEYLTDPANQRLVIIDEIDVKNKSRYDIMETVRAIHDLTKNPFLLIGMQGAPRILHHIPHFLDRISNSGGIHEARLFNVEDVRYFATEMIDVSLENGAAEWVSEQSSGKIRCIMAMLRIAERVGRLNGMVVAAKDMEKAYHEGKR